MSFDDLATKLTLLNNDQRQSFFELLAHNLTIAARAAWTDDDLSQADQVEALKNINECLHRVVSRIRVQRLKTHEWSDESFCSLLREIDSHLHKNLRGSIAFAAQGSYELASQ